MRMLSRLWRLSPGGLREEEGFELDVEGCEEAQNERGGISGCRKGLVKGLVVEENLTLARQ